MVTAIDLLSWGTTTWTILPSLFFHEVIELVASVTRMCRAGVLDSEIASFAPRVSTTGYRAYNDLRLVVFRLVNKHGLLASTQNASEVNVEQSRTVG